MVIFDKIKTILGEVQKNSVIFWVSLLFLNILLFLPQAVFYNGVVHWFPMPPFNGPRGWYDTVLFFLRRENQDLFRLSGEYYILLTALFLSSGSGKQKWIRWSVTAIYIFLFIYNIYDNIMVLVFGESPILYNDLMLLKGAFYLIIDISLTNKLLEMVSTILLIVLLLVIIPYLIRIVTTGLSSRRKSRIFRLGGLSIWLFIVIYMSWFRFSDYRSIVSWISPKVIKNVRESRHLWHNLKNLNLKNLNTAYRSYESIHLNNRPDVYLFMIESYGRILLEDEFSRKPYTDLLEGMEDSLHQKGWNFVSTLSESPITGGKSWLSMGSLINGFHIQDEALYSYIINHFTNFPHMINFFNRQGYHTFALQPLDRKRPGYSLTSYEKYYGYRSNINFEDLDFEGSSFGFRNIPDQYSINYAYEHFLKPVNEPIFLFFLTVSSHSPWIDLPPYPDDWKQLRTVSSDQFDSKSRETAYKLKKSYAYRFAAGTGMPDYLQHIKYEIKTVTDFILHKVRSNSIILILGDHQPPLITAKNSGFETPFHIISKDKSFLQLFKNFGFRDGLVLSVRDSTKILHEGIYSLLIRCLVRKDSAAESLPEYYPYGIPMEVDLDQK